MSGLPSSVLFACSHNAIRSPMAEAMARRLYGNTTFLDSVGVHADELDNFAAAVLDEIGVDVRRRHGKSFDDVDPSEFDLIVTLSPEAHHTALEFTRSASTDVEYWPIPDPSAVEGSRDLRLDAYRRTRDLILARLKTRFGAPSGPTL
jgi:protein-tyrosine-phosphatase